MRDVIVRGGLIEKHLPQVGTLLAEKASERFATVREFVDLLEFERIIAQVCEGVLLIVEGPGAIAELGIFSVPPEIREKLFVAVDSALHDGSSFISAGVLSYLEGNKGGGVHGVRGVVRKDGEPVNEAGATQVAVEFAKFVQDQRRNRLLSKSLEQVKYCLIFFAIMALRGAYLSQILEAMARFGFNDMTNRELRQILCILELVGWVQERRLGKQPHWFPSIDVNPVTAVFLDSAEVQDVKRGLSDIREEVMKAEPAKAEEYLEVIETFNVAA